jgi:hypothetical protein
MYLQGNPEKIKIFSVSRISFLLAGKMSFIFAVNSLCGGQ